MVRSLDLGTGNCIGGSFIDNKENYRSTRNCYLEINPAEVENLLLGKANITTVDDRHFLIGEDAIKTAAITRGKLQRPMRKGVINPDDSNAILILKEIIRGVVGGPSYSGEFCSMSIPAPSIDDVIDDTMVDYHKGTMFIALENIGYNVFAINEGLAIVFAENPTTTDDDGNKAVFTGIGISFGAGMVNICLAYKGSPNVKFSICKSGDWIDNSVAKAVGLSKNISKATIWKEKYLDFVKNWTTADIKALGYTSSSDINRFNLINDAFKLYYKSLIDMLLNAFVDEFEKVGGKVFEDKVEIILSGGASLPNGFDTFFTSTLLRHSDFPLNIGKVRQAKDPLKAVAIGALVAAVQKEKKQPRKQVS